MNKSYYIVLKYYVAGTLTDTHTQEKPLYNEDELEAAFGRNLTYEGCFQEFSSTFTFIKSDRDWIEEKYNDYHNRLSADTKIILDFYLQDTETLNYENVYSGRGKIKDFKINELTAECEFEEDSLFVQMKNKEDIEYTCEKDGEEYTYPILLNAVYDALNPSIWDDLNLMENFELFQDATGAYTKGKFVQDANVYLPLVKSGDEMEESYGIDVDEDTDPFGAGGECLAIFPYEDAESIFIKRGFGFNVSIIRESQYTTTGRFKLYASVEYKDGGTEPDDVLIYDSSVVNLVPGSNHLVTANDIEIELYKNRITHKSSEDSDKWSVVKLLVYDGYDSYIDFGIGSVDNFHINLLKATSFADGGTVVDTRIWQNYGDTLKYSSIFGHTFRNVLDDFENKIGFTIDTSDQDGTIYDADDVLLTTSRGVKGIQPLNYNIKWKELFASKKAFEALALSTDEGTLKFVPIEDVYVDETIDLGEVDDLVINENDLVFNKLIVGNSGGGSSNFDYGDLDFNAQKKYEFGLETNDEYEFTNQVRVDGATINKTAIDFEKRETSIADRDEDKDLYFIARNPNETNIESNFTYISGCDPNFFGQAINMEYSPSRQLYNWRNYMQHMFTGESIATLTSWEKNKELVYYDTDRRSIVSDTPETITDLGGTAIFGKDKYTITLPLTASLYKIIKANKNKKWSFSFKNVNYKGYLLTVNIPLISPKSGTIELIQSND